MSRDYLASVIRPSRIYAGIGNNDKDYPPQLRGERSTALPRRSARVRSLRITLDQLLALSRRGVINIADLNNSGRGEYFRRPDETEVFAYIRKRGSARRHLRARARPN